ncbi:MAG: adenylosuccinate lyase [Zoogloeaceae bacterium]|nr:adenylosuccinate lyase [Zoogloeaceae bacterium]
MSAYVIDSVLFRDQFGTKAMRRVFSDENTVQRWLDVEAALARVQGDLGVIPAEAAQEIVRQARVERISLEELKAEMDRTSHPIVPLLRAIRKICAGNAGEYAHWGATTQDIMDTGTVLQIRDALDIIAAELRAVLDRTLALAIAGRDQVMTGRSHGQQALPITFGYKAAVWAEEIRRDIERLEEMRKRVLVGQFSGAVGTLSALGENGIAQQEALFAALGLGCPNIAWHVARDGYAELACVLAITIGAAGKIAHEIYALQKTEVGELEEPFTPGKVGSSTMPHKRNPSTCETIIALARIVRSIAPLALEGVMAEHERDKIVLQTEREFLSRLFHLSHAALQKTRFVLSGLRLDPDSMSRNLELQRGLLLSEAVMMRLSPIFGRQEAHEIVYRICMDLPRRGLSLKEALLAEAKISAHLDAAELDRLLDPAAYTGLARFFVDRVTNAAASA